MLLDSDELGKTFVDTVLPHKGHKLVIVTYGDGEDVEVSIECEDCGEVLITSPIDK